MQVAEVDPCAGGGRVEAVTCPGCQDAAWDSGVKVSGHGEA